MRQQLPYRARVTVTRRAADHLAAAFGALLLIVGAAGPAAAAAPTNRWADNDLTAVGRGAAMADRPAIVTTSLPGEPTTVRALYRANDNHVHELSYTTSRSWADNDLTAIGGGPGAVATPVIVTTAIAGEPTVVRALYRGVDSHVHELSYISSRSWADNDLTAIGRGPAAADTPAIVTINIAGEPTVVRALYRSLDSHVHELSYISSRSWADNDLTAIGGGPGAIATPAIVTTNIAGEPTVVRALYRGVDSHVHELSYISSRSWADNDLTAIGRGPAAADTPAIVTTNIAGEPTVVRALYRSLDSHVHELSYISSRSWADNDLTAIGRGPAAAETPAIVTTNIAGEPTVVRALYRSLDSHVHELSYISSRSWADNDLTAIGGGPGAIATPAIVTTNIAGEPTVVRALYRSLDSHIHELSYISSRSWADNDLTAIGGGPGAIATPAIVTTNITGEPTVVRALYPATDVHLHELSYTLR